MSKQAFLKVGLHVEQVTADNIDQMAVHFGGIVEEGILSFTAIRDHEYKWYAGIGDWILVFDTNDVIVFPDSMFQRLLDTEDSDTIELTKVLPEDALNRKDLVQGVDKK